MKFIQAAENNKREILRFLSDIVKSGDVVLELGSGSGQHIAFFAENIMDAVWQPSEIVDSIDPLQERLLAVPLANLRAPWVIDISFPPPRDELFDFVYSSNVLQCISILLIPSFFSTAHNFLNKNGNLIIYGPFLRAGNYVSRGDAMLDESLKIENPDFGIKDFDLIKQYAESEKLTLARCLKMKKNNLMLLFKKI